MKIQNNSVITRINFRIIAAVLLTIIIILSFVVYNWPAFTGDMGISILQREAGYPSMEQSPTIEQISNWLNQRMQSEGPFRVLILPWTFDDQSQLTWLDPYTFSQPLGLTAFATASNIPNLPYYSNAYLVNFTLNALCNGLTDQIGALLALANVKYIIVNRNDTTEENQPGSGVAPNARSLAYVYGDPDLIIQILNQQKDLTLLSDMGNFVIYVNDDFYPYVSSFTNICLTLDHGSEAFPLTSMSGNQQQVQVLGLANDQTVQLYDVEGVLRASVQAKNLTAVVDVSKLSSPFIGYFEINDGNGQLIAQSSTMEIIGGSVYTYTPIMQAQSEQLNYVLSLSEIPGLQPNNQLMIFKSELSQNQLKSIFKIADVIVVDGSQETFLENRLLFDNLSSLQRIVIVNDQSSFNTSGSTFSINLPNIEAAHGSVSLSTGELYESIWIPQTGYYGVDLHGAYEGNISIDDEMFPLGIVNMGSEQYSSLLWLESNGIYLTQGVHNVSIYSQNPIILDQIIFFSLNENEINYTTSYEQLPSNVLQTVIWNGNSSEYWETHNLNAYINLVSDPERETNSIEFSSKNADGSIEIGYNPPGTWNFSEMGFLTMWCKYSKVGPIRISLKNEEGYWSQWDITMSTTNWTQIVINLNQPSAKDPSFDLSTVDQIDFDQMNLNFESQILLINDIEVRSISHIFYLSNYTNGVLSGIFPELNGYTAPNISELSLTNLQASADNKDQSVLVYGESYDPGWAASYMGSTLDHFKVAGYANGFYVNQTENSTLFDIFFAPQESRNYMLSIWVGAWIFTLVAVMFLSRKELRNIKSKFRK